MSILEPERKEADLWVSAVTGGGEAFLFLFLSLSFAGAAELVFAELVFAELSLLGLSIPPRSLRTR